MNKTQEEMFTKFIGEKLKEEFEYLNFRLSISELRYPLEENKYIQMFVSVYKKVKVRNNNFGSTLVDIKCIAEYETVYDEIDFYNNLEDTIKSLFGKIRNKLKTETIWFNIGELSEKD